MAGYNWDGHFFNPENNINGFTDHLSTAKNPNARLRLYHSVADGKDALFAAHRAFFEKIIELTYDLDNVYYELVHELAMNYSDWDKTSQWVEAMALAVRAKWASLSPDRPIILGTDGGHLAGFPFNQSAGFPKPASEMDWVFTRSYFDIMVYGNQHHAGNAREWLRHYRKPYIAQEFAGRCRLCLELPRARDATSSAQVRMETHDGKVSTDGYLHQGKLEIFFC